METDWVKIMLETSLVLMGVGSFFRYTLHLLRLVKTVDVSNDAPGGQAINIIFEFMNALGLVILLILLVTKGNTVYLISRILGK